MNWLIGRFLNVIGKQRPLTCKQCGHRVERDERLPRRHRAWEMGERAYSHFRTRHEAVRS